MKKIIYILALVAFIFSSCSTTSKLPKSSAYEGIYREKPITVLLMPPINRSTNVEAKEYFHSTLNTPLANAGYYVVPPFLSMEILKQESAYDAEVFLNSPLLKFNEIFGADIAVFTIIHNWKKNVLFSKVEVGVEYIIKSTKTDEILYTRKADVIYDTSVSTGLGIIGDLAISAINTASTKYIDVARACNNYTFEDLPAGKYSPDYEIDGEEMAGLKEFKKRLK